MLPDDLQKLWLLYENCLKARCLDEKLQEVYHNTRKGILFSGVGSEVGPAAVASLLKQDDYLIPRYRGYAALIAKGVPIERIAGEKLQRSIGTAMGIGDASPYRYAQCGVAGNTIVLGGGFAIAVGLALSFKLKKEDRIVAIFFGDGEASRNTLGGALNLASLWGLPLFFVCENNQTSISLSLEKTSATKTIAERAKGYNIRGETVFESEPGNLYKCAKELVGWMRESRKPAVLEILQKRYTSHSSNYDQGPFYGYMIPGGEDPLWHLETELRNFGVEEAKITSKKKEISALVAHTLTSVQKCSPLSDKEFFSIYHE